MRNRQVSPRQRELASMRRTRVQRTGGKPVFQRPDGGGSAFAGLVVMLVVLVMVGGVLYAGRGALGGANTAAATPMATRSAGIAAAASPTVAPGASVKIIVKSGDTWSDVADQLQQLGLIDSSLIFRVKVRLTGSNGDLEAGTYTLQRGMTQEQIIGVLEHATPPAQAAVRFTEGWRMEQEADALEQKGVTSASDFLSVTKSPSADFSYAFLTDRPAGATLEGYLFPDTYEFLKNSSAKDVVTKLLDRFGQEVTPQMLAQARSEGHSFYQVLIIASIVEREAAVPQERPLIAGVYWNRLKQGQGLYADPTVQYALGNPSAWWPRLDAEARTLEPNSLYNTYTHLGLPPGPICDPGLASIQAALNPQGDYLYFVAKGDGTHLFAHTLQEQNQNEQKVQQSGAAS
jgi:UPF0755 protein